VIRFASLLTAILAVAAGWGAEPAPSATRFAVVLDSTAIPSWFAQVRVPGWTAVDDPVQADVLVEVTGNQPAVLWTAYLPAWQRRTRCGYRSETPLGVAALGLGTHRLEVALRQRISGKVLVSVDLSRTNELVPCGGNQPWYLSGQHAWLPTPEGVAQYWCAQAWATGFLRTEQALRARLASANQ
jgi:hypothetical protein